MCVPRSQKAIAKPWFPDEVTGISGLSPEAHFQLEVQRGGNPECGGDKAEESYQHVAISRALSTAPLGPRYGVSLCGAAALSHRGSGESENPAVYIETNQLQLDVLLSQTDPQPDVQVPNGSLFALHGCPVPLGMGHPSTPRHSGQSGTATHTELLSINNPNHDHVLVQAGCGEGRKAAAGDVFYRRFQCKC
ncbi:unnamed protein product [Caretta caretta]